MSSNTNTASAQPFTTVIDVPPAQPPGSIHSDTQLNVLAGGRLGGSLGFDAGSADGTSTNVEVNLDGGISNGNFRVNPYSTLNINSGFISGGIDAYANTTINIKGGNVGGGFNANSDSIVNITGGRMIGSLDANSGSTINISGGNAGAGFMANPGSVFNITGGMLGTLRTQSGSSTTISGGSTGTYFKAFAGSAVNLIGDDFRLDGLPVPGLETPGDSVGFNLPTGGILTGIHTDGTVFIFTTDSGDEIADGTLTLTATTVPVVAQGVLNVPADPTPFGLRAGQELNLTDSGDLGHNFAAMDATLNIAGGTVGRNFELVNTTIHMTGGFIDFNFTAGRGSTVNLHGGEVDRFFRAISDSTINIHGGSIGAGFNASSDSNINLTGLSFILGNTDLTPGLTPGEPLVITDRDTTLEGLLADGTPFSFDLNTIITTVFEDYFDPNATVTITLAPEPATLGLLGIGSICLLRSRAN